MDSGWDANSTGSLTPGLKDMALAFRWDSWSHLHMVYGSLVNITSDRSICRSCRPLRILSLTIIHHLPLVDTDHTYIIGACIGIFVDCIPCPCQSSHRQLHRQLSFKNDRPCDSLQVALFETTKVWRHCLHSVGAAMVITPAKKCKTQNSGRFSFTYPNFCGALIILPNARMDRKD